MWYVDSLRVSDWEGGGKKTSLIACNDDNGRKRPRARVRDNQPFVLNCDMR